MVSNAPIRIKLIHI